MRVKLLKGEQRKFLDKAAKKTGLSWNEISRLSGICRRSFFDWHREKYYMTYEALLKLQKISRIGIPKNIKVLSEYWSTKKAARLGAMRRYELYGNPGTLEGRRKGGLISSKKFHSDPEYAKRRSFKLRKRINYPKETSSLAEFVGIMLGDGGIRNSYQITISFSTETEKLYAKYIQLLINELFSLSSCIHLNKKFKAADIVVSSRSLVEFLEQKLENKKLNKNLSQSDVPNWILQNKDYRISCLRGLVDTDGGIYYHRYKINGKWYRYPRLSFSNTSLSLVNFVKKTLEELNFAPKIGRDKITLYRLPELKRYFEEIGTHNPKHSERYKKVFRSKWPG
jgi:hypothetical protein